MILREAVTISSRTTHGARKAAGARPWPSSPAGARPYALLRQAMLEAGQVAVARVAIRTRECLAVLRVRENVIGCCHVDWWMG
ncbi:Ku protein [Kitasatospora sp. NPDC101235]|uniref:Ku protein n=1 Tax=Kitasatospora sp. NPDC101235 TaxID=3364101 RepID=UPI00381E060C